MDVRRLEDLLAELKAKAENYDKHTDMVAALQADCDAANLALSNAKAALLYAEQKYVEAKKELLAVKWAITDFAADEAGLDDVTRSRMHL